MLNFCLLRSFRLLLVRIPQCYFYIAFGHLDEEAFPDLRRGGNTTLNLTQPEDGGERLEHFHPRKTSFD